MTTIALRDGIMAADSQATGGDLRRGHIRKIFRLKDGSLLGISGDSGLHDTLVQWLDDGGDRLTKPLFPKDVRLSCLLARPNGRTFSFNEGLILVEVECEFFAVGSGNELAMGAMAMGASAKQAVEVAARYDVYTGLPITALALIGKKELAL